MLARYGRIDRRPRGLGVLWFVLSLATVLRTFLLMGRPGTVVKSYATQPTRGEPTDSGVWFVSGFAERGPSDAAAKVGSLDEYTATYGDRVSYGQLYDALECFFAEGGAEAYVGRVAGPAPTKGTHTFLDRAGAPVNTLRIDAAYPGGYSSRISVQVTNGVPPNTFSLLVTFDGVLVESFTDLASPAAAAAALAASDYVRAVDLASATAAPNNNPAVAAAAALSAGTDDHASATDASWKAALDLFGPDLGPGQVSAPGRVTDQAHADLIAHAAAHNRTAYLDVAAASTKASLKTAVAAVASLNHAEYAGLFGSWVVIPGLVPGTTRQVPGSAYAAGVTNRVEHALGNAGNAPAGDAGGAQYALDVVQPTPALVEADYEDLNDEGVNMIRAFRNRGVQLYGFRSVSPNDQWQQLTWNRERVSLTARLNSIALHFDFRNIDGKGHLASELNGALVGELMKDYTADVLYGATSEEAFRVDTGASVNTPELIAAGQLTAKCYARFSPFAELVEIDIVKVPITSAV